MIKTSNTRDENKNALIEMFRKYEVKDRIETKHMFKLYRVRLEKGEKLNQKMCNHIIGFIKWDVELSEEECRGIVETFMHDEVKVVSTLDAFL